MGHYVHGYHPRESVRLQDQAATLAELLHYDTRYPDGSFCYTFFKCVGTRASSGSARRRRGSPTASVDQRTVQ